MFLVKYLFYFILKMLFVLGCELFCWVCRALVMLDCGFYMKHVRFMMMLFTVIVLFMSSTGVFQFGDASWCLFLLDPSIFIGF